MVSRHATLPAELHRPSRRVLRCGAPARAAYRGLEEIPVESRTVRDIEAENLRLELYRAIA